MTIYEKPRAELFAQDAPESEIEPFTAWLRGLGIAFDETGGLPKMESFNGLLQALNGYIKYLEQNGFAEWSSDLEYPVGAGVRVGAVWYRAKTQNISKPPATSQNDWSLFLNASDLSFGDPIQLINGVISIKDASQAQKGSVQFANNTEISNKSDVSKVVNPANVATIINSSFSRNSQSRTSPDGFIMKWGTVFVGSDNNSRANFLNPFPTACINAQATLNSDSFPVNQDAGCGITWDKNGVNVRNGSVSGLSVSWFAIGY